MTLTDQTEFATSSSTLTFSPAPLPPPRVALPTSTSSPAHLTLKPTSPSTFSPFDQPGDSLLIIRLPPPTSTDSPASHRTTASTSTSGKEVEKKAQKRKEGKPKALSSAVELSTAHWTARQKRAWDSTSICRLPPLAETLLAN